MSINATLESPENPGNLREDQRFLIHIEAEGELEEGRQAAVTIHNLSTSGILIETRSALTAGQKISISLPEADATPATVVWHSPPLYGCRFDHILPHAVLSAAQLRNPLPSGIDPLFPPLAASRHEPLAARIFRLRRARGLSRAELAARTGLSKPSIWSWETGKAAPRHRSLALLAEALDISEEELLTGELADAPAATEALRAEPTFAQPQQTDDGNPSVRQIIDLSRQNIARIAGVEERCVRISIDY